MRSRSEYAERRPRRARALRLGVALLAALCVAPGHAAADAEALLEAARRGDTASVASLLDQGIDVDTTGRGGETALHAAAAAGHAEVVSRLLAAGAQVDRQEFDGDTALTNAAWFGHAEVVRLLLDSGADPEIEGSSGGKPLQIARRRGHSAAARALRDAAKRARRPPTTAPTEPSAPPRANLDPGARPRATTAKSYRPGYARRFAAVIGVNAYAKWPPLVGARPDAEKVAARLRDLGFDEVFELYDGAATRQAILALLSTRLGGVAGEDDLVVIFFAGHGETETIEGGRKRGYIVPVDGRPESAFSSAISMRQLRAISDRLPAKHVYYAMDSCYSGLGLTRGISIVKPGADDYFGKVTSLRSVQMVTAGGEGEEAIERDGEGVFTRSFLDAIAGAADANDDGYVTATEIGAYVAPRVTNETGARQSPQSGRLEGEGEIAFEVRRR